MINKEIQLNLNLRFKSLQNSTSIFDPTKNTLMGNLFLKRKLKNTIFIKI